jgi:hypothetical protein
MAVADTVTYYNTVTTMTVKGFLVQALGLILEKLLEN